MPVRMPGQTIGSMANKRRRSARVKLPRGVYEHGPSFRAEVMVNGARMRKAGFLTIEEAAAWVDNVRAELRDWKPGRGAFTLADAFNLKRAQLETTRRSEETRRYYEGQFLALEREFDPLAPLATIRKQEVQEFIARQQARELVHGEGAEQRRRAVSSGTIMGAIGALRNLFNIARKAGRFVGPNPVSLCDLPRVHQQRFDYLSENELRSILERGRAEVAKPASTWRRGGWDLDVFEFLALSGLRRRGLARLRAADCDPFKGSLRVFEKDGWREVPLSRPACTVLGRLLADAQDDEREFLVPGPTETRRASRVTDAARRIKERLQLDLRGCAHVARHSFGTAIANLPGASTWDVQHALGDRTLTAASRYVHSTGARRRAMVEQLGARISGTVNSEPKTPRPKASKKRGAAS